MGALEGRVAVITGAGRGLGREHALLFAAEGAHVVVNDRGGASDGGGSDSRPADELVAEIEAAGGVAVANHSDVTDADGAAAMIEQALDTYGRLDVLVNNAGILRDRTLANMTTDEWDAVINVHLRGHFLPLQRAAKHWRDESKAGRPQQASVINTTSTSGLLSTPGQANYGAAKSGIATMTEIVSKELRRYGVRCNAIAPAARTRLTATVPGSEARQAERDAEIAAGAFDDFDPANVSPFVAYLATADCPIDGKVFFVYGSTIRLFQPWTMVDRIDTTGRWSIGDLQQAAGHWGAVEFDQSLKL